MEINTPVRCRRTHTESFKQSVIDACQVPGTSVAGVALTHGVNANQVRRWLRERGVALPSQLPAVKVDAAPAFVPVAMPPARSEAGPIMIEVCRGTTVIHVEWPLQAAGDCAVWLRDWLR